MTNRFINRVMNEGEVRTRKYVYLYDWSSISGYEIIRCPIALADNDSLATWEVVKVMYK